MLILLPFLLCLTGHPCHVSVGHGGLTDDEEAPFCLLPFASAEGLQSLLWGDDSVRTEMVLFSKTKRLF